VLGEGYNAAWSAHAGGADLGEPTLVDGGFNGWRLEPSTQPTVVDMTWTAQRPVTVGLVISLVTAMGLVALVITARRRQPFIARAPSWVGDRHVLPGRERLAGAALVVASAILIGPEWALAALVPGLFVSVFPSRVRPVWIQRPFELVGLSVAISVALATLYIERRDRPFPDAGWTLYFDHLNGAAVFALLAVAAGTLFAPDAERRS